jgi:hypothetical protein
MDRFALRSLNLGLIAAIFGCSTGAWAQEAPATAEPAAAVDAPAATSPAEPPAPAPTAEVAPPAAAPLDAPAANEPVAEPAVAKPKPPPYSLPWQLRPVVPATVLRLDTAMAFYKNPVSDKSGTTIASMLLFSYKVIDNLAPLVRVGVVSNSPPEGNTVPGTMPPKEMKSSTGFLNPVLGATYGVKLGKDFKLGLFLGLTVPIGSGGGDDAKPEAKEANKLGIAARSAMDNAMFAVNDFTVFPGVGLAYVAHGFTAQVEATVLQLTRVKGDKKNAAGVANNPDSSRTNFTTGLHLGYFVVPGLLSLGGEIRHQRWLSTPKAVEADEALADDAQLGVRDTTTFAIGPRFHFKLSESVWFRPGVAFAMPLDKPYSKSEHKMVQLDLPFAF